MSYRSTKRSPSHHGHNHHNLGTFLIGLIVGIVLSVSLRLLSNQHECNSSAKLKNTSAPLVTYLSSLQNPNINNKMDNDVDPNFRLEIKDDNVHNNNNDIIQDQIESLDELIVSSPNHDDNINSQFSDFDTSQQTQRESSFTNSKNINKNFKPTLQLHKRKLLLVGVMTAQKYLRTRAVGVFETWAKEIPNGQVIFFTGANSSDDDNLASNNSNFMTDLPLVSLPDVDDSYPPQKKSFEMLKYMYEHYGDEFEWFMRADDDVYIKSDKLADLLRSINSRHLYFIGQAGRGNNAEKGTLKLAHNQNFCMGGPGIIFSRAALAKVAPFVQDCFEKMLSNHEDVEIGRCVQRFVGISCTWAYEMQAIFYHNSSGEEAFSDLKRREVHRAITLHPIKDHRNMYRLHSYIQDLKIQDLLYESLLVQRELLSVSKKNFTLTKLQEDKEGDIDGINIYGLPPSLNKFQPRNESNILKWTFLGKGVYSDEILNPKVKMDGSLKEAIEDVVREMMDIIHGFSRVRGRTIDFKEILYGYHRVNPLFGEDFIMDLLLTFKKYRGKKATVPVRRHAYIQRPFAPLQLRISPNNDAALLSTNSYSDREVKNLVMILPLFARYKALERFLLSFKKVCTLPKWNNNNKNGRSRNDFGQNPGESKRFMFTLSLLVVYFGASDNDEQTGGQQENMKFHSLVDSFRKSTSEFQSCQIKIIQIDNEEFSRSIALETGISHCSDNDLLFLIDVDILFYLESLERVTLNAVKGVQVYFPIVFSQYDPKFYEFTSKNKQEEENIEISDDTGYWRDYGFGIAAFYKSDFKLVNGFDTSIKGWGKEDVSLYEKFITTNLTIFRAPDPGLMHVYHQIKCDNQLSRTQYDMCLGTQANTLGSTRNLMKYIFKHRPASGHIKRFLEQASMNLLPTEQLDNNYVGRARN